MNTETETQKSFQSFSEFYPYYLSEHADRTSRRLHVIGTSVSMVVLVAATVTQTGWLLLLVPITGYGFAWVGHFFFEKNRPATFKHPIYSLMGDFVMLRDVLTGKMRF